MTRRAVIVSALVLLFHAPSAGAKGQGMSGFVRYPNPAPCTADECRLFLASRCTADLFVQESDKDSKPTAGNFASVVAIPPEARGKNGFLEWKLTGSVADDASWRWGLITTDCELGGPNFFELAPTQFRFPAKAGWIVAAKRARQLGPYESPFWWRWRQL